AGMVLLVSYFLTTLARLDTSLETVARLSPLFYYQGGEAILNFDGLWFGGLLAVAGLFTVLAWWRFEQRDIRVVGEGGWRWPWQRRSAVPWSRTHVSRTGRRSRCEAHSPGWLRDALAP